MIEDTLDSPYALSAESGNTTAMLEQQATESADNLPLKKQLTAHYVRQQNYPQALLIMEQIMAVDPDFDDQYASKAMLKIFILLGDGHELISQYRPLLRRYN